MATPTLLDLSEPVPDPSATDWNPDGVVHLEGFLPADLIASYEAEWADAHGFTSLQRAYDVADDGSGSGHWDTTSAASADPTGLTVLDADHPGGWPDACPYMRNDALRALCTWPPLAAELQRLNGGEPMGVHLNLTGWVSTRRNWHQDGYLNPAYVGDSYAAVWMALGDVHSASGVFQFVPGSHRWHRLTQEKLEASGAVDMSDPGWPTHTEVILTELVEAEIAERRALVVDYVPRKGDVLIWHPRLYHRGTLAAVENAYRPALIAHYSGIHHRPDMPRPVSVNAAGRPVGPVQPEPEGWYFPIYTDQPVR